MKTIPGKVCVDDELFELGRSSAGSGSWSREQLVALGIEWPLTHGWRKRITGTYVSESVALKFVALKNQHLPGHRAVTPTKAQNKSKHREDVCQRLDRIEQKCDEILEILYTIERD